MEKDFETRKKEFSEKQEALELEYQVGILPVPMFVPSETDGSWKIIVHKQLLDLDSLPVKSPFIADK